MRYEAKVDWWIGTALVAGMVIPAPAGIAAKIPLTCLVAAFDAVLILASCGPSPTRRRPMR
jgi:hypothetical protein